jgi:methylenetetrahydrofolate--tRNA-(uracil-5-)-methyltransferase
MMTVPQAPDDGAPSTLHVVGGGLAGSEAAWQAAEAGVAVVLHEMRPVRGTDAHHTDGLAELVCSNSFRSDDWAYNAVGLLHAEMRRCGSLILACADSHQVPAGGALAVDRVGFSQAVTAKLEAHPLIEIRREELAGLPPADWKSVILATGPLTSPALSAAILELTGEGALSFFDAIAPIVHAETIDMSVAWRQSRYDKEGPGGDAAAYINCPMDKAQYDAFIQALLDGPKAEFKDWEHVPYFDGCLPIEVMAERGPETLRHGPMKPMGLTNAHNPTVKAYAVVQLRQDNALGTLFNMVGFQTKLKHGAQVEVFRTIPGLERAEFARLGGLHRNTFINSPKLLDASLRLTADPRIRFAGQVTGVEGYVESAAVGLLAGRFAAAQARGRVLAPPPPTTALGALIAHVTGGHLEGGAFQPMNVNYGLLPPMEAPKQGPDGTNIPLKERGRAKKKLMSERALRDLQAWLAGPVAAAAE